MLAVLFGLLMVAPIDGPRPFQRNHNEHVPLGRVGHTGVMGDLMQQRAEVPESSRQRPQVQAIE
jgi:hypothetical protein